MLKPWHPAELESAVELYQSSAKKLQQGKFNFMPFTFIQFFICSFEANSIKEGKKHFFSSK